MSETDATPMEGVRRWLTDNIGEVKSLRQQPRWRPVWLATVDHDGDEVDLVVRGDRTDMPLVFPLDHEMRLQDLLHQHDIPVPKVYGWIDDPMAYVMEAAPGQPEFQDTPEDERVAVVDEYLEILARIHALDIAPFVDAGIMRAPTPAESGTFGMTRYDKVFRQAKGVPDPFMEFCLGWLRRNPPDSKGRETVIVWDSGQFHHQGGRVTAVLDVEIGHIGDPMMDLAAWRMRDTVIPYGDFNELYARYSELSGGPVDLEAIKRHHFAFTLTNQLTVGPATRRPPAGSDIMTNLQWCCETNLFATEALADILDVELPTVDLPDARESRASPALGQMTTVLRGLQVDDPYLQYTLRTLFRMSRHVTRCDEIGDAVSDADLDDLHELFGHRPENWFEGEAELERFVLADEEGRYDEALLSVFHKRNLRAQMLLGPAGSAMTHHATIQSFRD